LRGEENTAMKKSTVLGISLPIILLLFAAALHAEERLTWPRVITGEKGTLTVYQPQIERWDYETMEFRMAVEIRVKHRAEPVYGGLWLKAATDTSLDERLVRISGIEVSKVRIPSASEEEIRKLSDFVNGKFAGRTLVVSLDRILANVAQEPDAAPVRSVRVSTKAPKIFLGKAPTVLLLIEGEPLLQAIEGTGLKVVINANLDLYYDTGHSTYYLFIGEQWLSAPDAKGPWKSNAEPSAAFRDIPDAHRRAYIKDLLGSRSDRKMGVVTADPPAELILLEGEPALEAIAGTGLMYVKNTSQHLFLHRDAGMYYYMSSGRWFRAKRLEGPWASAGTTLPADFARIPEEHEKSPVLTSVPGTVLAREAAVEAQIPRKITVKRKGTTVDVTYTGEPAFEEIEGAGLEYAVNTSFDVFRVGEAYYVCRQGVWFFADEPTGPWNVSDTVPKEISAIPASHAKHYVTYVYVYGADSTTVTFGYTGGYTGVYVSNDVVVYGTGYYYPSTVYYYQGYPYYYSYPYTYWYVGYVYYDYPYYYYRYDYYPPYYYGRLEYHEGRYGHGYTYERGDYRVGYGRGEYKGAEIVTRQAEGPYGQWGTSVIRRGDEWARTWRRTTDEGTVGRVRTSEGGRGIAYRNGETQGGAFRTGDNDLYVGKDGEVYRHDEDGWAKYEDGNWEPAERERTAPSDDASERRESLKSREREDSRDVRSQEGRWRDRYGDASGRRGERSGDRGKRTYDRPRGDYRSRDTYGQGGRDRSRDTHGQLRKDRESRSRGNYRAERYGRSRSGSSPSRGGGGGGRGGRR
jgi:hypothetical protein